MTVKSLLILATIAFVGMIVVNALANGLPLNNLTTGEVADLYPSLFTPAGITFSIWSVIYLSLAGFLVYCWRNKNIELYREILPWFAVSCVLNASWILVWHYLLPGLSVFVMFCLLGTLIKIFMVVQNNTPGLRSPYFWVVVPFTIYLAWICVATIANISAYLTHLGWDGTPLPAQMWVVMLMSVAAVIGLIVGYLYRAPAFPLVIVWALTGIFLRWKDSEYNVIFVASVTISLIVLVGTVVLWLRRRPLH